MLLITRNLATHIGESYARSKVAYIVLEHRIHFVGVQRFNPEGRPRGFRSSCKKVFKICLFYSLHTVPRYNSSKVGDERVLDDYSVTV
jgi:hypothetical protein